MIYIWTEDDSIICNFNGDHFHEVVDLLKFHSCQFLPKKKSWKLSVVKFEEILSGLINIDSIDMSESTKKSIEELKTFKPELEKHPTRLLFKQELLKFPPIIGKPPNEDYQKKDILRSISRNRQGLFLDMGLGKSFEAAAIISHLRYYGLAHKVLFISSNIGGLNILSELKKFINIKNSDDLENSELYYQFKIGKDRDFFKKDKDILLTNYNTFRIICDYYNKKKKKSSSSYRKPVAPVEEWLQGKEGILILDESHNIGNQGSLQSQAILKHASFFKYRYLFTGTPADKPEKLYPQLKVLDRALVKNLTYSEWLDYYAVLGNRYFLELLLVGATID